MGTPKRKASNASLDALVNLLRERFVQELVSCRILSGDVTLEVLPEHLFSVCRALCDESIFEFKQLVDLCGIDYVRYGVGDWNTNTGSESFSRGVTSTNVSAPKVKKRIDGRFAVVYHLLSHSNNYRLRLRAYVSGDPPKIDSVVGIWSSADWFEREAFDLFGIIFEGHPDLRRILTDYGFIGHPLRKDFPFMGTVEVRYDDDRRRLAYGPVSTKTRMVTPRVIRGRRV
uniref:NADH-quinone oxidoreductase subunit C n=1 Tax=Candidatus Kentrum sp. MB TaxID=2138164 RepID=A0A451BCS5_9GAMM|nr:MAG: NADH dehydrogenase subunit C [Candidatus Kentron sp. MB]VFK33285.1 MAG: NADH dehydrogenase subunit C [Candidatus Kentron sp. MB]VFK76082.1 MAG: NADH dehydrogenase subunit C [Candidatus Kentron sp. MB]